MTDYNKLYNELNNAGEGYAVDGDDINAIEGIGDLVQRSYSTSDVAVYDAGSKYVVVGDANGLWAADVSKDGLE